MAQQVYAEVISKECLARDIVRLRVKSQYISGIVSPGQFVSIKCCDGYENLLRRPFSVADANAENNTFDIIFMIKGSGTAYLAGKNPGDSIDVLGPLGRGFDLPPENSEILAVGGGIGVFPLLFLMKSAKCRNKNSLIGFKSREYKVLISEFQSCSSELGICTDDGTYGSKGFVTDLLEDKLKIGEKYTIYSCGPSLMMKRVAELAEKYDVKCQLSLEQHMGCGIGACLVCSCKIKTATEKGWHYARVCKDGPVFWSNDIIWE